MTNCLDSWAILEWLSGGEPAKTRVSELLDAERPVISWINLGEVAYVLERRAGVDERSKVVAQLRGRLTLDLPDPELVLAAASVKARYLLAYADAFAVATAQKHKATLLTGDPEILDAGGPWALEDLRGARRQRTDRGRRRAPRDKAR